VKRDLLYASVAAATIWLVADVATEPAVHSSAWAAWALGLVVGGAQVLRRRMPVWALGVAVVAVLAYNLAGFPAVGLVWPLLVPYLLAASAGHLRPALGVAVVLGGTGLVWRTVVERDPLVVVVAGELQALAVVGLALAVGEAVWQRGRWAAEVRSRLARARLQARRDAEQRAAEQRLAVAADLHDVLAHQLVVIGLRLRLAEETVHDDPRACAEAVAGALAAHDAAVRETTATVRLLRGAGGPLAPVPGLAELAGLRAIAAAAGVDLDIRVDVPVPLPAATALVVYRICQEAVTNTIKHARARAAVITVDATGPEVTVTIRDDGTGASDGVGGYGLEGMAERVRGLGGDLRAGPADGAGFVVEARIPAEAATGSVP
jgi:signal transduction histidine kinase